MLKIRLSIALLVAVTTSCSALQAGDKARLIEEGRSVVELCAAGDAHRLFGRFNSQMAAAVPENNLAETLKSVLADGKIGRRISDEARENSRDYRATHSWGSRELTITMSFDSERRISGLLLRPSGALPPDPRAGYVTKAVFRLPFNGEWWVAWGGDTREQNYHVIARDQRHAYDILVLKGGSTFRGDRKRNEDYYAFGQPVLAPAAGTVLIAVDGVADNVPGVMNPAQLYGNHVLIDLGNSEYLAICHFKSGSIKVKPGQKVRAGDLLGLCGNSGNSSEAHIHIHLQDRPQMGAGATGLPLLFSNYQADGKLIGRGVPVRGQTIRPR